MADRDRIRVGAARRSRRAPTGGWMRFVPYRPARPHAKTDRPDALARQVDPSRFDLLRDSSIPQQAGCPLGIR